MLSTGSVRRWICSAFVSPRPSRYLTAMLFRPRYRWLVVALLRVVAGGTPPEEPATLAMRILDVLRSSGPLNRRQLLQAFVGTTVKPGTVDSAVYRLVRRRMVEKRGERFAVVGPQPSDAGYDR